MSARFLLSKRAGCVTFFFFLGRGIKQGVPGHTAATRSYCTLRVPRGYIRSETEPVSVFVTVHRLRTRRCPAWRTPRHEVSRSPRFSKPAEIVRTLYIRLCVDQAVESASRTCGQSQEQETTPLASSEGAHKRECRVRKSHLFEDILALFVLLRRVGRDKLCACAAFVRAWGTRTERKKITEREKQKRT